MPENELQRAPESCPDPAQTADVIARDESFAQVWASLVRQAERSADNVRRYGLPPEDSAFTGLTDRNK